MKIRKYFDPEMELMDREELEALQFHQLKLQLRRCYRNSEFYREKFEKAGIKPEDIRSLDDVTHLPFITKQDLMVEQQAHPPFGRYTVAPPETWAELRPSPGTTSIPINTIWSHEDIKHISRWTARTMWNFGVRPGDIIQNGFGYGIWVAGISVHYAARELGCFVIPIGTTKSEWQIDYFLNPGSTVLLCTPSYALNIAESLKQRGISPEDIPLRIGCFGGETGAEVPATRDKIEKGLGIQAFDCYGLTVIGPIIATECSKKAGIHWIEDHLLVEIIDPETLKPSAPGEVGVLVITHLTKEATPMIRYWTDDYARLDKRKCKCGRTHARSVGGVFGRAEDRILCEDGSFFPAQVENVVRGLDGLSDEFCIELTTHPESGKDTCTLIVESLKDEAIPQNTSQLKERLKNECEVTPEIRFVPYGTLKPPVFRAKRVVDKRETKQAS
ncbi:MAG: phenylacetate--CoA ligase family protein [Thermodesulfobacteriota bacterium]|nr:phenylacetate--CoA ligase family protein [Thermodesulfobacteriota bacterium]